MNPQKNNVHTSMIETLLKCGIQFDFRYNQGIIRPPGIANITGKAVHKLQDNELTYKVNNDGQLFELEQVKDTTRDAFEKEWQGGVLLNEKEAKAGLKKTKGEAIDVTMKLGELYHNTLAPVIQPRSANHIEWSWVLEMDNYPFNIAGTTDIVEKTLFRDLKNLGKTPSQAEIDESLQYTIYNVAYEAFFGEKPKKIIQDTLVKNKKPVYKCFETSRTDHHTRILEKYLEIFAISIEKGIFMPASTKGWWCSASWCGYTDLCPYFRGKKTYAIS